MKRAITLFGLGAGVGVALIAYPLLGPHYDPEPLRVPVDVLANEGGRGFHVGHDTDYLVELHIDDSYFGDGAIIRASIEWELVQGETVVGGGEVGLGGNPSIMGDGYRGFILGTVLLTRDGGYTIRVSTARAPRLAAHNAVIRVGLHPSQLDYLGGYVMIGSAVLLVFGTGFLACVGVAVYRWGRR